ncbi:MAG: hypothetical protein ACHQ2Z_09420 [Elusimicrobiota bacterium]
MSKMTAAVAGATGLVGGLLLRRLLDDPEIERVVAPTRRPLAPHAKLVNPIFDGTLWPSLPPLDEAYGCLGTTRKRAGSDEAFRAVDLVLTRSFARAAKAAGARRFGLVSSIGADKGSRFLYLKTKGEAEAAVSGFGFESVAIVRPSFLIGNRAEHRPAESLTISALHAFEPVLVGPFRRWRGVRAETVAGALISALRGRVPGTLVLESDALRAS